MKVRKYLSICIGAGIVAFGIFNVHSRCAVTEGGAVGLSLLLYHWFGISPGISGMLMNFAALAAGTVILQNTFLKDSIMTSIFYAVWYRIFEYTGYMLPNFVDKPLIATVLGGLFIGVGTALIVRFDCAGAADDALALIFQKCTGMRLTIFYVFSDLTILLLSLTYIPVQRILWSIATVMISSGVITILCPKD